MSFKRNARRYGILCVATAFVVLLATARSLRAQVNPDAPGPAAPPPVPVAAPAKQPVTAPPAALPAIPAVTLPAVPVPPAPGAPAVPALPARPIPSVVPPAATAVAAPAAPEVVPPAIPALPQPGPVGNAPRLPAGPFPGLNRDTMRAATAPLAAGAATKSSDTNKAVALKFNGAPLDQVLQYYSDLTGRTILQAPSINATVTLRSQSELTIPEAMQAIKTILSMNNVGLVEVGEKFVKVVPIGSVQIEGLPIQSNVWQQVMHPENDEMISEIIPLKAIDPAEALKAVQGLIHPYGKILSLERINSLMVADTTININRIKEVLGQIDIPIELKEKINIIRISHAKASEIKTKLEEIIADQKDKDKPTVKRLRDSGAPGVDTTPVPQPAIIPGVIRARPATPATPAGGTVTEATADEISMIRGNVKVIADDRTGMLIIITRIENMPLFEQIVNALDVGTAPDVSVRMIRLEYADSEVVAAMLNTLIGAATTATKDQPKTPTAPVTPGTAGQPAEPAKSSPLQEYLQQQREMASLAPAKTGDAKTKIGQLSAENIRILADKRSNGLIIMASANDMAAIMDVLKSMDVMLSQVLIEAVILSVNLDDKMQSGVDWVQRSMIAYSQKSDGSRNPLFAFAGGGGGGTASPADATAFNSTFSAGQGLTYYFTHFGLNLDAVVHWASSDSRTRVLDSPVILTTDNKVAKIDVSSQKYVYKGTSYQAVSGTSSYQTVPNVDLQKVGLTLSVTPHINQKKFVVMEIDQKIDSFGDVQTIAGQGDWPTINSREMSASIAVRSGESIILGGLVENTKTKSRNKIPILGDIPILGIPFRSSSDDNSRQEVVVFITPRVLDTPEEIEAESHRRKDATDVQGMWTKGWSDSKLADPAPSKFKQWWRNLLH